MFRIVLRSLKINYVLHSITLVLDTTAKEFTDFGKLGCNLIPDLS
jgi:hypothetical protein